MLVFASSRYRYAKCVGFEGAISNVAPTASASTDHFTGSIPRFDGPSSLEDYLVDANQLTGPLPSLDGLPAWRFSARVRTS